MNIIWYKYFDRIYCLHSVQYTERKQLMDFQLNRVGILHSGIFEYYLIYNNFINNSFNSYMEKNVLERQIDISILLSHYKIIRDAYFRGYNRILIMNDNIKFLDDLDKIKQIIQNKQMNNIISYNFFNCYQLDKIGMKEMINLMEKYPTEIKNYFNHPENYFSNLIYSYSKENIVEQTICLNPLNKENFSNEVNITEDLTYNLTDQITSTEMNVCFVVTSDYLDKLNILIYSFKKYSQKNSKLNFYFITDTNKIEKFEKQLEKFKDSRTTFKIVDCSENIKLINTNFNHFHTFISYMKMFIPMLFPKVDKMLYMDYDTFLNKEGIELLFNLDIENYYLAAIEDVLFLNNGFYTFNHSLFKQYTLFKHFTEHYISSGVMLINSKKIRQDGFQKKILQFLKQDPPSNLNNEFIYKIWLETQSNKFIPEKINFQLTDQSVINFIFKNKKKIISPIFNNLTPFMNNICYEQQLNKDWGFKNYDDYFEKSIVYHTNQIKPWFVTSKNKFILNRYTTKAIQKYNKMKKEMEEVLK